MRNKWWLGLMLTSAMLGCGASQRELAVMRSAHYRLTADDILELVARALKEPNRVVVWRPNNERTFITEAHWYTPEGLRSQLRNDSHHPGSVKLAFAVTAGDEAEGSRIVVAPIAFMHDASAVKLTPLDPSRADWLPWIDGKTDSLVEDIFQITHSYVVKAGAVPATRSAAPTPTTNPVPVAPDLAQPAVPIASPAPGHMM